MDPKGIIDVVIPAFNAAPFIEDALSSVIVQGQIVGKIIVVNDGSTDSTRQIVENFSQNYPNFDWQLLNQKNSGLSNARNTGILFSTSKFIAFLDADDIWLPNKLNAQYSVFINSQDKKLGVVYCGYFLINSNKDILLEKSNVIYPKLKGYIYPKLLNGNFISGSGSSVLIKRKCLDQVGNFDESLQACEDWDLWLRISKVFHFDFIDKEYLLIRVHYANMQKNRLRMLTAELMLLNKFVKNKEINFFLLWKIRTILVLLKINPDDIEGFNSCDPHLKKLFSNLRIKLIKIYLYSLSWFALLYLNKIKQRDLS